MARSDKTDFQSLKDHFLVAMPGIDGGLFDGSVTLLCDHDEEGALGLIVNHPTRGTVRELFSSAKVSGDQSLAPVLIGGPVETGRGFVLHTGSTNWESSLVINENLTLTTSYDIVEAILESKGPEKFLFFLGYAGWGAGQIEQEVADNAWLTVPASQEVLFDVPFEHRANTALASLGINLTQLSTQAGHA